MSEEIWITTDGHTHYAKCLKCGEVDKNPMIIRDGNFPESDAQFREQHKECIIEKYGTPVMVSTKRDEN